MRSKWGPVSVIVVAVLYIVVGTMGFIFHFPEIHAKSMFHYDGIWIELVEIVAVVSGVFILRGRNWARWLAIAWMAFHVALSAYGPVRELVIHSLIFVAIAWLLFCPPAARFFHGAEIEPK